MSFSSCAWCLDDKSQTVANKIKVTLVQKAFREIGGGNPAMEEQPIWGRGGEIPLAAPCYRNKPDITTVLKGHLTCMQTLHLCPGLNASIVN